MRIVDDTTGAPVAGVEVTTVYWSDPETLFSPRLSRGITDDKGRAFVEVYRAAFAQRSRDGKSRLINVLFRLAVDNAAYREDGQLLRPIWDKGEPVIYARPTQVMPSVPDDSFRITSLAKKMRLENIRKAIDAENEKKVAKWLKEPSTFWPPQSDEMWPSAVEQLLVTRRWKEASTKLLGNEEDLATIKAAAVVGLPKGLSNISQVRWLSNSVVMADGGWYGGSLDAGSYLLVLKKIEGRWIVVRKYLQVIS